MLYLFHGDDTLTSRIKWKDACKRDASTEVRLIDGKTITATDLTQALESHSLFGNTISISIDQLFSKRQVRAKNIDELVTILVRASQHQSVYVYEEKELPVTILKKLGAGAKIVLSKLPQTIFVFLDSFTPKDRKGNINRFMRAIQNTEPELVFSMLTTRIRQLLLAQEGIAIPGAPPWQAGKLKTQSNAFTSKQLRDYVQALYDIDQEVKTGLSPVPLGNRIQRLLALSIKE